MKEFIYKNLLAKGRINRLEFIARQTLSIYLFIMLYKNINESDILIIPFSLCFWIVLVNARLRHNDLNGKLFNFLFFFLGFNLIFTIYLMCAPTKKPIQKKEEYLDNIDYVNRYKDNI